MDRTAEGTIPLTPPGLAYRLNLAGFVLSLALTLLTIVDFRRGFLFTQYVRSPYTAYHPSQLAMLAVGMGGALLCYRNLKAWEERLTIPPSYARNLLFTILALLVIDLFIYRGVPATRAIAAGKVGATWLDAFGASGWQRPIALTASYLLTVWHATLLGALLAGLALTIPPIYVREFLARRGFAGTLIGALYALPQPFCSCCAAVMSPSYARRGASTNFSLSFVVGSPMLNITTLILAFTLLPLPFALARLGAGILLTLGVTYGIARLDERWKGPGDIAPRLRPKASASPQSRLSELVSRWTNRYLRAFSVDALVSERKVETPAALLSAWLYASFRLALILVPTLFLWGVLAAFLVQVLPPAFGNNLPSIVLAAVAGTLLMISTWTEIPVALQLIQQGFTGPAATLLVVLPSVSLPCLMLLGGALRRLRLVALLGLAVAITGVIVGMLFL